MPQSDHAEIQILHLAYHSLQEVDAQRRHPVPKVATQSILKLVPEMLSEEWQDIFVQHLEICNAVHISIKKEWTQNDTIPAESRPNSKLRSRITSVEIKLWRMSFRCVLSNILRVYFSILVSNYHMFQKMGVFFAFLVEPLRKLTSPQIVVWQQLVSHVHSVWMLPQIKPCNAVEACRRNLYWIATSTHLPWIFLE